MPPTLGWCKELKQDHVMAHFVRKSIREDYKCKYCGQKMEYR